MPKQTKKPKTSIASTARGYFHDLDPYSLFPTKDKARQDRSLLFKAGVVKSRKARVSTFYTILQDKRKNDPRKFGAVPQGPHTFPHHGIHTGLVEARKQGQLDVFANILPSPGDYNTRIEAEIPSGHAKRHRAEIAMDIYAKRHKRMLGFQAIATPSRAQQIAYAHVINKMLQMDPHGSYAYKGKGAGRGALKGKGESTLKPIAQQIDLPTKHGFSDLGKVTTRNTTLLSTLGKLNIK